MHDALRRSFMAIGLTLALGLAGHSWAQERHEHGSPVYGGKIAMTKTYQFEVVCATGGLRVYARTHEDKPIDVSRATGTATFYHPNSSKPWFNRPLRVTPASPGQTPSSLTLPMDLSAVPPTGAKVEFKIEGLSKAAEPATAFTVPFTLAQAPQHAASSAAPTISFAKATRADHAAITAQRVCKVSGESLGSMGTPIKVTRGDRSVFLCCQGCLKDIQADPDRYLGKPSARDEHAH